ncbi:restriction endonuclease subunit S [Aeromonas veronii]
MAEQMMQHKADELAAKQTIPAGYKQTEVGVIPEDWKVDPLGVLINQIEYGSSAKSSSRGRVPVLRMGNLQDGQIDWGDLVYTNNDYEISKYELNDGDLLFNRTNSIDLVGKTALYKGIKKAIFAGYLIRIKVDPQCLDARYLNYFLNTPTARKYGLSVVSVGVSQANINGQKLKSYPIPYPAHVEEQVSIATALSDTDALITGLEQLIAKKQAIKTASMQQLLTGRTRLPQFARGPDGAPKSYKSSELGQIPEDWDVVCAGDLGKFRGGNGFPVIEQGKLNGEYPFYKVSDMNNEGNDVYMSASNNWISKEDQSRIGSFVFPSGCIVFAKVGAAVFLERKKILSMPSCIDNNMAALELNIAKCDVNFVYHFLQSIRFGDFVSTTALPSLNASVLSKIKIIMPLIKEQTAIATILSDMDNELQALTQKLAKARDVKQGMMQQLLTGRIRLPLPQEA